MRAQARPRQARGRTGVDGAEFVRSYRASLKAVSRDYARLIESPGEEEVHAARTATRRAEAHLALLPRRVRAGRACKELKERYRRVMKTTGEVRDMDIIGAKLSREPGGERALTELAAATRKDAVRAARDAVASASKLDAPPLAASDAHPGRLLRRLEKVTARLSSEVDGLVPAVVEDPSDMKDLHRLRIDIKRLRYLAESVAPKGSAAAADLEVVQDALGSIHDWDVSIAYVKKLSPRSRLLPRWRARRSAEFSDLVERLRGPIARGAPRNL
ncbi:MAG: CHAD domain-containing protein [Nitrososphaerota archaeon]|nr:CHAD domain-containing protein [Nitrososphaerota archaeon]MDG6978913.1 CHAD domain-containing protein [Nitrososphaerota archaeon]